MDAYQNQNQNQSSSVSPDGDTAPVAPEAPSGNGQGGEGSAPPAPPPEPEDDGNVTRMPDPLHDTKTLLWRQGVALLKRYGDSDDAARRKIGMLLKDSSPRRQRLSRLVDRSVVASTRTHWLGRQRSQAANPAPRTPDYG